MKPAITKLVDKIIRKLQESGAEIPSEAGIRTWLKKEGHAAKDVDAALEVIRPELVAGPDHTTVPRSTRVLSAWESYFMTPEARAALTRLEMYGVIGAAEREMVLERLDQFDGEVDLSALEYMVSTQICPGLDVAHQQMVFQIFDGRTDMYH